MSKLKRKLKRFTPFLLLASCFLATSAFANSAINVSSSQFNNILKQNPGLKPAALRDALDGYHWAIKRGDVGNKNLLTIVDFTIDSKYKRLWVIDIKTGKTLMHLRVANGKNSGLYRGYRFSNRPGTDESSLGVYTTAYLFYGEHGLSLKVNGLERGINNNAMRRAIEFHPAWYASPSFVKTHDRVGRSWGCFAVNPATSKQLFETIKNHTVVFAYAPQENHDPNIDQSLLA